MTDITHIMLDIDGCISDGKGKDFDLVALQSLKSQIQQANTKGITTGLCTGRSMLYVEAVAQMLNIRNWCVCENGAYLYHPVTDEVVFHPHVSLESRQHLHDIKQILTTDNRFNDICRIEMGKEVCISLIPINNIDISELFQRVTEQLASADLYIAQSTTAVDITPKNINKGSGLQLLCKRQNLFADAVLGVGDTMGDLTFLHDCGRVACPVNAIADIKAIAHFVSKAETTNGLVEIYQWLAQFHVSMWGRS